MRNMFWRPKKNAAEPSKTQPVAVKRPCLGIAAQPMRPLKATIIKLPSNPNDTQRPTTSVVPATSVTQTTAISSASSLQPVHIARAPAMTGIARITNNNGIQRPTSSLAISGSIKGPTSSATQNNNVDNENNINNHTNGNNNAVALVDNVTGQLRRPMTELAARFRSVFEPYLCFNMVQSMVFDTIFQTDDPIIVSAPTGSGKTGIFELAIIKMIQCIEKRLTNTGPAKVVYLAPTKALCNERRNDWAKKFKPFNIDCIELTSDLNSPVNYRSLNRSTILLATPEKWDSVTRNWNVHKAFIQSIRLLLVDEVHLINDGHRGATLEAVLSRMKIIRSVIWPSNESSLRFIAVSATVTNVQDIADWLSSGQSKAQIFQVDARERPVQLRTFVLGYSCPATANDFRFDALLNHKLPEVLRQYSNHKPALIFCATRKAAVNAAQTICREGKFDESFSNDRRTLYLALARQVKDKILQETVRFGVAYHHAGLTVTDRRLIEDSFLTQKIMFLCCTSTLAVGVNLPAHLVVIKNTFYYDEGSFKPYPESSLIQMMGRAGRPQFDTHATAVIMTKMSCRDEIERMLTGKLIVESHLHKHLTQHLNSEIVLGTVTNELIARKWIDSTYLHVRLMKCPENYGLKATSCKSEIESSIINWCDAAIKQLLKHGMASKDKQDQLQPTDAGRAMARHYICLDSMVKLLSLTGNEDMWTLLQIVVTTSEVVNDIQLRTEDRPGLFKINNPVEERQKPKYPFDKIDTREKKALLLIQAAFGNVSISEINLFHESLRVLKNSGRVCNCLKDLCIVKKDITYGLLRNVLLLAQCFGARLWNDSIYVSKQIEKIGATLSHHLAHNGLTTFETMRRANPRNIEVFCNRLPPFGSKVQQTCYGLPIYGLKISFDDVVNQPSRVNILVEVSITNGQDLRQNLTLPNHTATLIVGALTTNKLLLKQAVQDNNILGCADLTLCFGEEFNRCDLALDETIEAHVISDSYVGLNVTKSIKYIN